MAPVGTEAVATGLTGTGSVSLQLRKPLLKLLQALLEGVDGITGVGQAVKVVGEAHGDDAAGHADDGRVRRDVLDGGRRAGPTLAPSPTSIAPMRSASPMVTPSCSVGWRFSCSGWCRRG